MKRRRPDPAARASLAAWLAILLAGCAFAPSGEAPEEGSARPRIVIDGVFDDWTGAPTRPVAQTGAPALDGAADGEALYLRIMLPKAAAIQALAAPARLMLDLDGSVGTGADVAGLTGTDLVVELSPREWPGGGVGVRRPGAAIEPSYAIGFAASPTHASDTFEMRIERTVAAAFAGVPVGPALRARFVSDDGRASGTLMLRLPPAVDVPLPPATLARAPGTLIRVATWNVADAAFLNQPDAFARVLRALAPDVVLLDELPARTDIAGLRSFFERLGDGWHVLLGESGGRQRGAVAARFPLEAVPLLARVEYPDSVRELEAVATFPQTRRDLSTASRDGVPAAAAVAEAGGLRILFVSLDLACCGGASSPEDGLRRIQARAIRDATARVPGVDAVVAAGDFNLVGSRMPLEILTEGLDPRGGNLMPVPALQLDGRSAATWRAPGPFPPGRLDWILYSPAALAVARAFAFEADDLPEDERSRAGVLRTDTDTSDHLPVVADLRPR